MTTGVQRRRRRNSGMQILALSLIGAGLVVLGVLGVLLLPGAEAPSGEEDEYSAVPVPVKNYPAPELELKDLEGNAAALSDFAGQVVLVNNWATWCPPCKAEMPALQAYYEAHRSQGFTILAIEAGDTPQAVAQFKQEYGLTFPVWPDPEQKALVVFRNFSLPNSYVIDRQGQIRLAWTGAISLKMLEKYVTPLVEE